jgi:hypothetical protein
MNVSAVAHAQTHVLSMQSQKVMANSSSMQTNASIVVLAKMVAPLVQLQKHNHKQKMKERATYVVAFFFSKTALFSE